MTPTNITKILKNVLLENLERQRDHNRNDGYINDTSYALEFQTLQLNFGRQMGHTTAIENLYSPGDAIFVPTAAIARYVKDKFKTRYLQTFDTQLDPHAIPTYIPVWHERIWVDCASMLTSRQQDMLYARYVGRTKQFILLG